MTARFSGPCGEINRVLVQAGIVPSVLTLDLSRMVKCFKADSSLKEKWVKDVANGSPYGEDRRYHRWVAVFGDLSEGEVVSPHLKDLNLDQILKLYQEDWPEFKKWKEEAEQGNLFGQDQKYKM